MSFLQKLSTSIVIILFTTILVLDLFIQPEYHFDDFPYFEYRGLLWGVVMVIGATLVFFVVDRMGKILRWNVLPPILFYLIGSIVFLWAVPMIPMSDQGSVFSIASNGLDDPQNYMSIYANTTPTIMYLFVLASIFGKSLWVPKAANVLCGLLTLIFTSKIYGCLIDGDCKVTNKTKCPFSESERKMLWWGALFLPAFFYNNHIYNEVPSIALAMLMLYLVIKGDDKVWVRILTVIISCLQFVLRQTGIILVLAAAMYIFFYQKKRIYALVYFVSVIAGYLLIEKCCTWALVGEGTHGYPIWSWVLMGINESEFGFQDNNHSFDITFLDCVNRYKEYGPLKVITILCKKTFWVWGEGSYQSGRYGFGYLNNPYEYATFVTEKISESPDRKIRIVSNILIRSQYLFYMLFALIGTLKAQKKHEFSVLFYIICGFFAFYLIWEIKSRYLYGLYPIFLLLALYGWEEKKSLKPLVLKLFERT